MLSPRILKAVISEKVVTRDVYEGSKGLLARLVDHLWHFSFLDETIRPTACGHGGIKI